MSEMSDSSWNGHPCMLALAIQPAGMIIKMSNDSGFLIDSSRSGSNPIINLRIVPTTNDFYGCFISLIFSRFDIKFSRITIIVVCGRWWSMVQDVGLCCGRSRWDNPITSRTFAGNGRSRNWSGYVAADALLLSIGSLPVTILVNGIIRRYSAASIRNGIWWENRGLVYKSSTGVKMGLYSVEMRL